MCILILARYEIKRLMRHRLLLCLLFAPPLAAGLVRAAFHGSAFAPACAQLCALSCLVFTGVLVCVRALIDRASGLSSALENSVSSPGMVPAARVVVGALIFAAQVAMLVVGRAAHF
jgi:hypothetical protein